MREKSTEGRVITNGQDCGSQSVNANQRPVGRAIVPLVVRVASSSLVDESHHVEDVRFEWRPGLEHHAVFVEQLLKL
jgi:hypothetical protein